jgi:hypothetical protein
MGRRSDRLLSSERVSLPCEQLVLETDTTFVPGNYIHVEFVCHYTRQLRRQKCMPQDSIPARETRLLLAEETTLQKAYHKSVRGCIGICILCYTLRLVDLKLVSTLSFPCHTLLIYTQVAVEIVEADIAVGAEEELV